MVELSEEIRNSQELRIRSLDERIHSTTQACHLARAILGLRSTHGWDEYVRAINDIRAHALRKLAKAQAMEEVRSLQGQIEAYDNLLVIVETGEERAKVLDAGLQRLQNERLTLQRHMEGISQ